MVLRGGGAGVWEWHGVPKRCTRPINRFRPVGSGGRLPSGTKIGEGGYHGETFGAELEDLAYKGLGGTVPPHCRAVSTSPSAYYALRVFNGCCNHLSSFLTGGRSRGSAVGCRPAVVVGALAVD